MHTQRYLTFLSVYLFFNVSAQCTLIQANDLNLFSFVQETENNRYNTHAINILRKTNKRQERSYDYSLPHPITALAAHTDGAIALSYQQNSLYFITNRPSTHDLKTVMLHGKPMDVHIDGDQVYVTVQRANQDYGDLMIYSRLTHALVTTIRLHANPHKLAGNKTALFIAHGKDSLLREDFNLCGTGLTVLSKANFSNQIFHRTSESPDLIYADETHVFLTTKFTFYFFRGTAPTYELNEMRISFAPHQLLLTNEMIYVLSEFSRTLHGLDVDLKVKVTTNQFQEMPIALGQIDEAIIVLTKSKNRLYFFEKNTLRPIGIIPVARFPLDLCIDWKDIHVRTLDGIYSIPESTYGRLIEKNRKLNEEAASFDVDQDTDSPSLSDHGEDDFAVTHAREEEFSL